MKIQEIRVSLVQQEVQFGDQQANLTRAQELLKQVPKDTKHEHLILFPELFTTGYAEQAIKANQEEIGNGEVSEFLQAQARTLNAYIYASFVEKAEPKPFNTGVLISPQGTIIQTYRKVHLFKPLGEAKIFEHGEKPVTVDLPWGKTALQICYDLRFPEQFVHARDQDVTTYLVVAEWPITRVKHWLTLARARAIENQAFLIAVNRVGTDPTGTYGGHSVIIDPLGEDVLQLGYTETVASTLIPLSVLDEARRIFTVKNDAIALK